MGLASVIRGAGGNANVEAQVDKIMQALRVTQRPLDWSGTDDAGGHYYFETATGALTGAAANSPIFTLRNPDSHLTVLLLRLSLVYYLTTAYTGAQMNDFEIIRATGWTVADSGGAAITPAKARLENMANPKADIRIATTAALTAGTRTIDSTGIRAVADGPPNVAIPTATLAVPRQELVLYDLRDIGSHPVSLDYQEGIILRNITAMSAAGVIKAFVMGSFVEIPTFGDR